MAKMALGRAQFPESWRTDKSINWTQQAYDLLCQPFVQQESREFTWLREKIKKHYPKGANSILEIGSCMGESMKMLSHVAAPGAHLYMVDIGILPEEAFPFNGVDVEPKLREVRKYLQEMGFKVTLLIGDSHDPSTYNYLDKRAPYDVVFIDGDHTDAGCRADWRHYGPMGRLVCFHDIAGPVRPLWQEIKATGVETEEISHVVNINTNEPEMGIGIVYP